MTRDSAEASGWTFVAEQEGYFRAEKFTLSGELINFAGVDEADVLAQIDSWENYPVQAPDTRGVEGSSLFSEQIAEAIQLAQVDAAAAVQEAAPEEPDGPEDVKA